MATIECSTNPMANTSSISFIFDDVDLWHQEFQGAILRQAVSAISQRFVEDYYEEIRAALLANHGIDAMAGDIAKQVINLAVSKILVEK